MLTVIFGYCAVIIFICYVYRPANRYSDFIVGNKTSGWTITAFGLFTLIGGGELVAGASLGYLFGWSGMALFIGFGIAFVLLGLFAKTVLRTANPDTVAYAEYATQKYGKNVGLVVLTSHIVAFFSLLVLQLSAGGHVISHFTDLDYTLSVLLCAVVVGIYLFIGGFKAVMVTDLIQGFVMLFLVAAIVYAALHLPDTPPDSAIQFDTPDFNSFWGVMISGVIIGLASADVWQRVFAAKSSSSARKGLIAGGIALAAYGSLIVFIGILGKTSGLSEDADNVFLNVLQNALPPAVLTMAVLATISAILSTADTEIFLVSSLLERGYRQFFSRNSNTKNIEMPSNESFNRIYIIVIVAFASILSLWGTELGLIFNWMFVGYMVFAPTIAISLFIPTTGRAVLLSFGATLFLFILLLALEYLTLENAYLLTLPAVIILPYASIKWRQYVSSPR